MFTPYIRRRLRYAVRTLPGSVFVGIHCIHPNLRGLRHNDSSPLRALWKHSFARRDDFSSEGFYRLNAKSAKWLALNRKYARR